jgi:hypothetical protein
LNNEVKIEDGQAIHMGEGAFAILQKDEYGKAHSVVLSRGDLEALLAAGV